MDTPPIIQGLYIDLTSTELRKLLNQRATAHREKAEKARAALKALDAAPDPHETALRELAADLGARGPRTRASLVERLAEKEEESARLFSWMAERIARDAIFRLPYAEASALYSGDGIGVVSMPMLPLPEIV